MRPPRALFAIFFAVPMALLTLLIGAFVWIASKGPAYDTQHPDYAHFRAALERAADELSTKGAGTAPFDFAPLNGGKWKTACLFGGYSNPVAEMRSRGAVISEPDAARLDKDRQGGFRLYAVEEGEALIAYIDDDNRAHFIHFRSGLGQHYQSPFSGCISKPLTTLILVAS